MAVAAIIVQIAGSALIAAKKPMWHDELLTFYFERFPTFGEVYAALLQSVERSTPFFYFVTRIPIALFGANSMSIRIPGILAVAMMCICLYIYIERRTSSAIALLGILFSLVTEVFFYSFEGRAYGLLVGFTALSLLSWQSAAIYPSKKLHKLVLGIASFGTAASHYYGIFGLIPIGIGEIIRSFMNRRIQVSLWLALSFGILPLILMLPLIQAGRALVADFWPPIQWTTPIEFFRFMLEPALLPLIATLILLCADCFLPKDQNPRQTSEIPIPELAAAFGFLLLPFFMVLVGKFAVGAFTERYASVAIIGLATLFSYGLSRFIREGRVVGLAVAAVLGGWLVFQMFNERNIAISEVADQQKTYHFIASHHQEGLPTVISNAQVFFLLSHYAAKETAPYLLYLSSVDAASRMIGTGSVERILAELKDRVPLNIQDYDSYVATHPRFLLYWKRARLDWMLSKLVQDGAELTLVAERDREFIYLGSFPTEKRKR